MLDLFFQHLAFFVIGIFQDILTTYYYQAISKDHAWKAGIFSTIVTLVNLIILYQILVGIEDQVLSIILAYAVGNGVGTTLVIKKHHIKNALLKKILFFKNKSSF